MLDSFKFSSYLLIFSHQHFILFTHALTIYLKLSYVCKEACQGTVIKGKLCSSYHSSYKLALISKSDSRYFCPWVIFRCSFETTTTTKHSINLLEFQTDVFEHFLEYSCGIDVWSFFQMGAEGYQGAKRESDSVSEWIPNKL